MNEAKSSDIAPIFLFERVYQLVGLFGFVGALCYVVGYLVMTMYLNKFGVHNLSLVESRYFAAGLLYVALSSIISIGPLTSLIVIRKELANSSVRFQRRELVALGGANFVFVAVLIWATGYILTEIDRYAPTVIPISIRRTWVWLFLPASQIALWFPFVLGGGLYWAMRRPRPNVGTLSHPVGQWLAQSNLIGLAIICIGISIYLFATRVYPHVSRSLGGGAPVRVRLLLAPDIPAPENWPLAITGQVTEPVDLIDQTDSQLLIVYGGGRLMELSAQSVTAILYDQR